MVAETRYKAYGEEYTTSGSIPTTYRYTGQRNENELGLMYYGARWYDPALGRWAQADTIVPNPGNPQSLNRYSYCLNNPVSYIDPDGHIPIPLIIAGAMLLSKAIDYGWTAWDSYQSLRVINDPKASESAKSEAKANLALTAVSEAIEPDDLLPIGLPLDDLIRKGIIRVGRNATDEAAERAGTGIIKRLTGDLQQEHLRQLKEYGKDMVQELKDGRIAYYDKLKPATTPGEMFGTRKVRLWDPRTGEKRTWFETLDHDGRIRILREEISEGKIHYLYDAEGNLVDTF